MTEPLVFDLARREHARHLLLVDTALDALGDEGILIAPRLAADLSNHARSEHTALIAALLLEPRARQLARSVMAVHRELRRMLSDPSERHTHRVLATYRARFVEYVCFEEGELFQAALMMLGTERCERLSGRYEMASGQWISDV